MVKKLLICFFTTIFTYPVFAVPIEIVREEVIDGAENYTHIEPLLNIQNELSGFIYTDSINSKIIYDNFETGEYHVIDLEGGKVFKTIHSVTTNLDSVFIYTLDVAWLRSPRIHKIVITNNSLTKEELVFPVNGYHMSELTHSDFLFNQNMILVEFSFSVNSGQPPSYSTDNESRTFVISPEAFVIADTIGATSVKKGALTSQFSNDRCELINISSEGYSPYWGYYAYGLSRLSLYDQSGLWLAGISTDFGDIFSFFIDNFAPSNNCEELILYANAVDLLDPHTEKNRYIACYSFENIFPEELWYNDEINDITLHHVFKSRDLIIGLRDSINIVMIDYLSGLLYDSTTLAHTLRNIVFFENGFNNDRLNLIGLNHDTVFVYRFDTPTNVNNIITHPDELPATFTLLQNHPNPFNGETRLEFSNTQNQFLSLKVYNILGQEIKSLAARNFGSGHFTYYWDGKDEHGFTQATGVYFARLESEVTSQMIKLIYLK